MYCRRNEKHRRKYRMAAERIGVLSVCGVTYPRKFGMAV